MSRYAAVVNELGGAPPPPPSAWLRFLGSQRADEVRADIASEGSELRAKVRCN